MPKKKKKRIIPAYCKGCLYEHKQQCEFRLTCPYFQTDLQRKKRSICDSCPYVKGVQCVGFCIKAILNGKSSRDLHGGYDVIRSDRDTSAGKTDGPANVPAA